MTAPLRVPLIETQAMSEFGDLRDQAQFYNPDGMDKDPSYVPGFSEMKRDVALQMAEVTRGLRHPKDVTPLPVNLRWARNQNIKGDPDNTKQFGHSQKGYQLVTKDDIGKRDWLTALPPGTRVAADGTICRGDTALMWCPKEQAAKNEFAKRRMTEERTKGAEGAFAQMIENARGVSRGATPFTKTEPASPATK